MTILMKSIPHPPFRGPSRRQFNNTMIFGADEGSFGLDRPERYAQSHTLGRDRKRLTSEEATSR